MACNAIQRSHSCPPVRKTHSARCYFSHVCTPEWQLDTLLHQESGFLPPNLLQPALGRMSLLTRVENLQSSAICSQVPQLTSWETNGRRLKVGWVGCLLDHMLLLRLNKRMIRTRSVHHHFSLPALAQPLCLANEEIFISPCYFAVSWSPSSVHNVYIYHRHQRLIGHKLLVDLFRKPAQLTARKGTTMVGNPEVHSANYWLH